MVQALSKPMLDLRAVAPRALDFERFKLEDSPGHCEVFPSQWMERTSRFGIFAPDMLFAAADRLGGIFDQRARIFKTRREESWINRFSDKGCLCN